MAVEQIVFVVLALFAVATALLTITRRNPVSAAMWLVGHFATLGGLYLTLNAQFIAVIQVLVYAGAIMVLVLFVIMLLNITKEEKSKNKLSTKNVFGIGAVAVLGLEICAIIWSGTKDSPQTISVQSANIGTVEFIGHQLFTQYSFPFEAISFVLLAAIVGAVMLAKKNVD
ncbi:MAG TPA: NADH-quinone oxidoreductase subunit J [Candidatus Kapabacteria bacterium]|nr:NADH-quinone oxidoreductase subunit J [Candidatus Kapabacteria bacterium]